jgi:hypothetical protein
MPHGHPFDFASFERASDQIKSVAYDTVTMLDTCVLQSVNNDICYPFAHGIQDRCNSLHAPCRRFRLVWNRDTVNARATVASALTADLVAVEVCLNPPARCELARQSVWRPSKCRAEMLVRLNTRPCGSKSSAAAGAFNSKGPPTDVLPSRSTRADSFASRYSFGRSRR